MSEIKKSFERDAARVNLRKLLDTKKRGDHITPEEIAEATGFDDWRSFRPVIRRWAKGEGFALIAVPNEGYRIGAPDEQVIVASKHRVAGTRNFRTASHILVTTPVAELSDVAARRHERELIITSRLTTQANADDKTIRKEFKLGTERVPLRLATGFNEGE